MRKEAPYDAGRTDRHLLSALPNASKGKLRRILMQLDNRRVHIEVQCGDADCRAEQAYRQCTGQGAPHVHWTPFRELRSALDRAMPPVPILDQDGSSILVQGDDARLRIIVSAA
jgi:hypothetical protein